MTNINKYTYFNTGDRKKQEKTTFISTSSGCHIRRIQNILNFRMMSITDLSIHLSVDATMAINSVFTISINTKNHGMGFSFNSFFYIRYRILNPKNLADIQRYQLKYGHSKNHIIFEFF